MSTKEATESRWYFVHTYSGQEDRVKKNLEQRIATMDKNGERAYLSDQERAQEIAAAQRVLAKCK